MQTTTPVAPNVLRRKLYNYSTMSAMTDLGYVYCQANPVQTSLASIPAPMKPWLIDAILALMLAVFIVIASVYFIV